MRIIKSLKYFVFEINEEYKTVKIIDKNSNNVIILNKTYAFSLARFLIRYFFRLSINKKTRR